MEYLPHALNAQAMVKAMVVGESKLAQQLSGCSEKC